MRIAIFADNFYPELSGIADTVLIEGKELAERGHQITYFVPRYTKKEFDITKVEDKELILHKNITIKRISSFGYPTATKQGRGTFPNIFRGFFYRNKFDVVHTHSFFALGIEAYCFAKINRIPLIGTNHTIIESFLEFAPSPVRKYLPKYLIWFYNRCFYITTPSNFLLKKMKKEGLTIDSEVISNPIEKEFFISESEKNNLHKTEEKKKFRFLYVGRLSAEKNVEILIEAFNDFFKNNNYLNAELVLVGSGVLRSDLQKKIKTYNLEDIIKIKGPFMGETKKSLYEEFNLADVFVTASTSETQSMVLLQSMAATMSSIVANAGPLPKLVADNRGLIFNPHNKKEIAEAMKKIYLETDLRREMAKNSYNYVAKYSVRNITTLWEKLYTNIIRKYANKRK